MSLPGRKKTPLALASIGKGDKKPGADAPRRVGPLVPPRELSTATQKKLWDEYIEPAFWLQDGDSLLAYIFIQSYADYLEDPKAFSAAQLSEMRRAMQELHLGSSEKARMIGDKPADGGKDKYFS